MKQFTIRCLDSQVETAIEEMSRKRQWSLNQVVTHLMRKGLGLTTEVEPQRVGDRLDKFWGIWSSEERQTFDSAIEENFGQVDEEWR